MALYNAGALDDSAPIFRWTLEIQGQEWLELAVIAALDTLTNPANWLPSSTTSQDVAAERATDATITFQRDNFMIGTILATAGQIPPFGLMCDGSTLARVDYPQLYDAINPVFIIDADNFRLPDLTNRVIVGTDEFVGDTGGEWEHTLTIAETPSHTHDDRGHSHIESAVGVTAGLIGEIPSPVAVAVPANTGLAFVDLTSVGGGQAHNNMPPYMFLTYYIIAR